LNINIEDKHLNVTDSNNRYIIKDLDLSNYNGESIYLDEGLSMVLKNTSDTNFKVKLTNGNKLDFGDMAVTNSGSGEDLFFTLNNIKDALEYNIVEYGIGEPSAWQSDTYKSEAKPFLQGEFSGNYNDKWSFNIDANNGLSTFHLQGEQTFNLTGKIDDSLWQNRAKDIDYNIVVKDGYNKPHIINIDNDYDSTDELIEDLNNQLADFNSTAYIENGYIKVVSPGDTNISLHAENNNAAKLFGFTNSENEPLKNTIISSAKPNIHLSDKSKDERTIAINIIDDDKIKETYEITLEQKNYDSLDDVVSYINSLEDLPNGIDAKNIEGRLAFSFDNNIDGLLVESKEDNELLGFNRIGDSLKLNIVDDEERLVKNLEIDTAGRAFDVADGVKVGFDEGIIYAKDHFTATVGSGIRYELSKLDEIDKNLLLHQTKEGNKRNLIDSTINFNDILIETNEEIKADDLGSKQEDIVRAATELQRANQAYQAALAATTMNNQISILNFLQ
ncbi:MAG: hypothetical protein SVN78_10325, partial [Deferribacterota bacterium]|nr:hypothetical protein [Deferribacterota bacterium]